MSDPVQAKSRALRGLAIALLLGIGLSILAPRLVQEPLPDFRVTDVGGYVFLDLPDGRLSALSNLLVADTKPALPTDAWTAALEASALAPARGAAGAGQTVVEFFDYRCPLCRVLTAELRKAVEGGAPLRWIVKDWPILTPDSEQGSKLALAAGLQGAYWQMHDALIERGLPPNAEEIRLLAEHLNLDARRLVEDLQDRRVSATLESHDQLARGLGLLGTPAVVIDCVVIAGALPLNTLLAAAAEHGPGQACLHQD